MEPLEPQLSIFYISTEKIDPNPFQPRKEFSEVQINNLSQSVRRYGILQPLIVTKKESINEVGNMSSRYELIAGERRLRAAKQAGLDKVPVVIRNDIGNDHVRLELAIIENLQREDLNPVDRARAFKRLVEEFTMTHSEVAQKMGRSREYITNSLRLLTLPEDMINAITINKISEGHTRPLLMLSNTPHEQRALFDEIINRKITVRDSEIIARKTAIQKVRVHIDPKLNSIQSKIEDVLDTRVYIKSQGENGGKIVIDYFSPKDLEKILNRMDIHVSKNDNVENESFLDEEDDDEMYNFKNFSL